MTQRVRIVIHGAVQGVGFRPFIFRLASASHLTGWVSNGRQGVFIEAEGTKEQLDEFLVRIERERPPRASIQSLEYSFADPIGFLNFEIRSSDNSGVNTTLVLPDIATCSDCLNEIMNPADRRYGYPFTNCTNCGPRFTIVESLPYDRANTTMRKFEMCAECRREYEDPSNRRFHAQPNGCPDCGPHLELWDSEGRVLLRHNDALIGAVELLQVGRIVAVKGLGGFHLMTDAADAAAVARLRERKHREEKPFALMAPSIEGTCELCELHLLEERALRSPEAPIVLLTRHRHATQLIAPSVAPGNPYLGVMLPYTPLHHLVMKKMRSPLVATSGNRCDEPICTDERAAIEKLRGIADVFLVHNRPIRRHVDDSIVRVLLGGQQILRRARGYAPLPIAVKQSMASTLAVGGHMKNAIAFAVPAQTCGQTNIFLSQHIGDLETKEAFAAFHDAVDDLEKLYDIRPDAVVCDLHPESLATVSTSVKTIRVQHHCAHVASCMAENGINGAGSGALGVAWDGTGYGFDGTIWGGEFILAAYGSFRRVAHFRTFSLPGGSAAIKKPRQTALGVLFEIFGDEAFDGSEPQIVRQMLQQRFRSPRTSSVGRLFDAVASLCGIRDRVSFEGQAAMELEFAIDHSIDDGYSYFIRPGGPDEPAVIDWEPVIREVLKDVQDRVSAGIIAARFHNTLCEIIPDIAARAGVPKVVLSGGCFQNRYLTERAVRRLTECGFQAHWHQRVPPNDGGIALGQAVAARAEETLCASQSQAG